MTTTATRTECVWDEPTQHWIVRVGGPGNPIARSSSKQLLEDFLDYLENRERETVPRNE